MKSRQPAPVKAADAAPRRMGKSCRRAGLSRGGSLSCREMSTPTLFDTRRAGAARQPSAMVTVFATALASLRVTAW